MLLLCDAVELDSPVSGHEFEYLLAGVDKNAADGGDDVEDLGV